MTHLADSPVLSGCRSNGTLEMPGEFVIDIPEQGLVRQEVTARSPAIGSAALVAVLLYASPRRDPSANLVLSAFADPPETD